MGFKIVNNRSRKINRGYILFLVIIFLFTGHFSTKTFAQADDPAALYAVCSACHTIGGGKLIGPDLQGISDRHDEAWLIKFIQNSQEMIQAGDETAIQLFEEFNNIPMPPNAFTDDQVRSLLAFIEGGGVTEPTEEETSETVEDDTAESTHAVEEDLPPEAQLEANRNFGTIFFVCLFLMLLAIFDLFVTKLIKARFVHIMIILIALFVMGEIIFEEAKGLGRQQFYSPDQPIAFSHKVHAGQNQIDCQYCHFTAQESRHAGIPPMALCMNCHNVVKEGSTTGTDEIAKIYKSIESGRPIEWVKVHNVPDHVYFSHAQHVVAGKVECQKCHGAVEEMDRVIQVEDLGMGWCVNCHRDTEVDMDNPFYANFPRLHEDLKSGKRSRITVDIMGGNDCQRCHY